MLHAGLDLSRKKLDICLLSDEGEHLDQLAVAPDVDSLRRLARRIDEVYAEPVSATKLLACDPTRFKHEAAFARGNGTAPLPASSGKTIRQRLNRGGDRQVNNAIHTIAVIRAKHQPETRAHLQRRIREGKTKREALRALKRHISRDLFKRLAEVPLTS
jgi:hypothetical protein